MNIKRVTRLLKVLQMLQAHAGENADGLAEATGVSRRTAFRDIEALKEAGVPVAYDRDTDRYSLPGGYFLPPTNFTAEEALAVIGITTQLGRRSSVPFFEPARRAAQKLEASLPPDIRQQIQELTRVIHIRQPQVNPLTGKDSVYQTLVDAHARRRQVWMEYDSLTEWERITTVLRPYQLMFNGRSWFVIGRSSLHKEARTFNIERIASLDELDETFVVPRGFSLRRYLGNAWRMIPESGPDSRVHLRFASLVAKNVEEVRWHATQEVKRRDDGSLDFWVTVSGINEISWWILQYGDQVEVISPVKLRRLIAGRIARMSAVYNGKKGTGDA